MADEVADAIVWLSRYALPGPLLLARLLQLNDDVDTSQLTTTALTGVWSAPSGRLCPLLAGAALSDCALQLKSGERIEMAGMTDPLLLLPFAASAALLIEQAVGVEWLDVLMVTDGMSLNLTGNDANVTAECVSTVKCSVQAMGDGDAPTQTRVHMDADSWSILSGFAQRTYAPATESSRLLGAGTGLGDSD